MKIEDPYFVVCCPMCGSRQATVEASYRDGDIVYQDLSCRDCGTVYMTSKKIKKED